MTQVSYPFAVGRIKALEDTLIDAKLWQRLIDADADEALHALTETGYGSDAKDKTDIESLVEAELASVHGLMNEIAPEPELMRLFLLPEDAYNLKVLLKGIVRRTDTTSLLHSGGSIPVENLVAAIEAGKTDALPKPFADAVKTLLGEENPAAISIGVDKAVFETIDQILSSKKTKSPLLKRYFTLKIDSINILSVVRANALHWQADRAEKLFIPGGDLSDADLKSAVGQSADQLSKTLAKGIYSDAISAALDAYAKGGNIAALEEQLSNVAFSVIHEERGDVFGIGPIINYLLIKEHEAKSLRVLFAGKKAGIAVTPEELGVAS